MVVTEKRRKHPFPLVWTNRGRNFHQLVVKETLTGISKSLQSSSILLNGRSLAHFLCFLRAQYQTHWFMFVFERDFSSGSTGTLLEQTRRLLPSSFYSKEVLFKCTIGHDCCWWR